MSKNSNKNGEQAFDNVAPAPNNSKSLTCAENDTGNQMEERKSNGKDQINGTSQVNVHRFFKEVV